MWAQVCRMRTASSRSAARASTSSKNSNSRCARLGGCNVLLCGRIQLLREWQSAILQQLEEPALYIDDPVSATEISSRDLGAFNAPCIVCSFVARSDRNLSSPHRKLVKCAARNRDKLHKPSVQDAVLNRVKERQDFGDERHSRELRHPDRRYIREGRDASSCNQKAEPTHVLVCHGIAKPADPDVPDTRSLCPAPVDHVGQTVSDAVAVGRNEHLSNCRL